MPLLRAFFRYTAFPLTLLLCTIGCTYAILHHNNYAAAFSLLTLTVLAFYLVLENFFPYRSEWEMTFDSFVHRDAKFLAVNTLAQELGKIAIGWAALKLALGNHGILRNTSAFVALPVLFLSFEFLQYAFHRISHELRGRFGTFLWRIHAAHHLPDRLYVMIHAVGHPLELLVTNVVLMLGLPTALGCTPEVTFIFLVFANAIGLVSHLNVDLRLGWLNYLFVGPESHRFHHSTETREAGNYAAILPIVDILFGTFVYRPGTHPKNIGVPAPETYPASAELTRILTLPFSKSTPAPISSLPAGERTDVSEANAR